MIGNVGSCAPFVCSAQSTRGKPTPFVPQKIFGPFPLMQRYISLYRGERVPADQIMHLTEGIVRWGPEVPVTPLL